MKREDTEFSTCTMGKVQHLVYSAGTSVPILIPSASSNFAVPVHTTGLPVSAFPRAVSGAHRCCPSAPGIGATAPRRSRRTAGGGGSGADPNIFLQEGWAGQVQQFPILSLAFPAKAHPHNDGNGVE